jgi:catechol 2,3-dioxygenase-like lactoylglutathione lyase family enzyme
MSRVQLALRVSDLEGSIAFYRKLFGVEPAKRRPGYANFAITEPPLKLVLIEGAAHAPTALDHLGVEVSDTAGVAAAAGRLTGQGLATDIEDQTTCCYAVQDKVWVTGPGAERWEVYTVLADDRPELEGQTQSGNGCDTSGGCCAPAASGAERQRSDLAA